MNSKNSPSNPDTSEPSADRKAQLKKQLQRNTKPSRLPCQGITITSLGELNWVIAQQEIAAQSVQPKLRVNLSGLRAFNVTLRNADLRNMDLHHVQFVNVDLSEAKLNNANFSNDPTLYQYLFRFIVRTGAILSVFVAPLLFIFGLFAAIPQLGIHGKLLSSDVFRFDRYPPVLGTIDVLIGIIYVALFRYASAWLVQRYSELYDIPAFWGSHVSGFLTNADLTQAKFRFARMRNVDFQNAVLDDTDFNGAFLRGADFRGVEFDKLADRRKPKFGRAVLSKTRFDRIEVLSSIVIDTQTRLESVYLGDPFLQRQRAPSYDLKVRAHRERSLRFRQEAAELRKRHLYAQASYCRLQALRENRRADIMEFRIFQWAGSMLLDVFAAFGEGLGNVVTVYLVSILAFAAVFYFCRNIDPQTSGQINNFLAALVFSVTSFHGRGFFPSESFKLDDLVTVLAASEAVLGLFIEALFIATFGRRFLED